MVFGFFGHDISQEEIVRQAYGGIVCMPGSTLTIAKGLSRVWTDSGGSGFRSRIVAAFDPANGVNAINNNIIAQELAHDHPLLYCNTHHAMVLTAVTYFPTQPVVNIQGMGVVDPWPASPRLHNLTPAECIAAPIGGQMTFLATIRVEDLP